MDENEEPTFENDLQQLLANYQPGDQRLPAVVALLRQHRISTLEALGRQLLSAPSPQDAGNALQAPPWSLELAPALFVYQTATTACSTAALGEARGPLPQLPEQQGITTSTPVSPLPPAPAPPTRPTVSDPTSSTPT
eukprot:4113418-Pyramimonas_sp.AAC.1